MQCPHQHNQLFVRCLFLAQLVKSLDCIYPQFFISQLKRKLQELHCYVVVINLRNDLLINVGRFIENEQTRAGLEYKNVLPVEPLHDVLVNVLNGLLDYLLLSELGVLFQTCSHETQELFIGPS